MKVVWQEYKSEHGERMYLFDPAQGLAQQVEVLHIPEDGRAAGDYLGDKNDASGQIVASDVAHVVCFGSVRLQTASMGD